jgi:hypothetical protein
MEIVYRQFEENDSTGLLHICNCTAIHTKDPEWDKLHLSILEVIHVRAIRMIEEKVSADEIKADMFHTVYTMVTRQGKHTIITEVYWSVLTDFYELLSSEITLPEYDVKSDNIKLIERLKVFAKTKGCSDDEINNLAEEFKEG